MKRIVVWVQHFADRPNLVLQWHDPVSGKRKSRSAGTGDPAAAEVARADHEYRLNHGLHQDPGKTTWERFRAAFDREFVAARRPNTQEDYQQCLDRFERLAAPRTVGGITERTLSAFYAALRAEDYAPSTIKVNLQRLRTALRWAAEQGLVPGCPKFPKVKVPRRRPQPLPSEAWEKVLEKAGDDQMRAYLLCGWLAGLRRGEAHALEWEPTDDAPWVDLARRRIVLPAKVAKADEDQWVPLAPALAAALEALPRRGRRVFRFENRFGRAIGASAVGDRVRALARRAGVKLSMHSLRKGFGCYHAGKVPAQVLQKLMRHADIKTTMDYYANVDAAVENAVFSDGRHTSSSAVT